ncbi:meiosis-specific topoisomerase Spo11 [Niveomyces insectorum RCEF 264]|uniref:DNA topoisomerase (ATP-hydrolyzing) n=1 Tax=Niveomyces insectorum RCEF 264 TaxID=1081102 RepID=A0A167S4A1_9HYPO|nr:meiosis-specific topoisomerase Spo11 [Niveomyces insectorum RCEF 264]
MSLSSAAAATDQDAVRSTDRISPSLSSVLSTSSSPTAAGWPAGDGTLVTPCVPLREVNFPDDASPRLYAVQAGPAIVKIEQIIEAVFDGLGRSTELTIPFSRRPAKRRLPAQPSESTNQQPVETSPGHGCVSFPGKSAAESKLFTQVLSILQLSHQALLNIFYQHRDLFRDQRTVDNLVDDVAYTLGTGRDALNIVAASVGVVCGRLSLVMKDGSRCCASSQEAGLAIPLLRDVVKIDLSQCHWILVIEKEATFRTLAASGYWNSSMAGAGALVTSKGYPTLVTRAFLHRIHAAKPQLPMYGLVDYDPHGVRIFRTYKYGSARLRHEDHATVPGLKWLGIHSGDLVRRQRGLAEGSPSGPSCWSWSALDDVLPLTDADRKTAVALLRDMCLGGGRYHYHHHQDFAARNQCREVQVMLMLNVKAEIQAADDYGDLTAWLDEKLYHAQEGGGGVL